MSETVHRAEPVGGIEGVVPLLKAGRVYFAGQPSEAAIRSLAEQEQIKTLVSFRQPMEPVGFDAAAVCDSCGIKYISIPFGGGFTSQEVDELAEVLDSTDENIVLHCVTSNRVGAIWAAYLATKKGVPMEEAIEAGKSAGITMPKLEAFARAFIGS